jgi:NifU-like protein
MHCSVMGREALEAAMVDYFKRQGRDVPCDLLQTSRVLCHCFQVSKETVREAIMTHRLAEIEDVTNFTKAGGGCTDCHHEIGDILRECWAELGAEAAAPAAGSTQAPRPAGGGPVELAPLPARPVVAHDPADGEIVTRIQRLLDDEIATALGNDGGGIEFVRYADKRVYVRLTGTCAACRKSDTTIEGVVEDKLRELVDDSLRVIEVDHR